MYNFKSINELKDFFSSEVLFTNEAVKFLGITSQRLHQLVQSGKITPLKASRTGSLFLKSELNERLNELSLFEEKNPQSQKNENENDNIPLLENNTADQVEEAINYFTIQTLSGGTDKKAKPIYEKFLNRFDLSKPILIYSKEVIDLLSIDETTLIKTYKKVRTGFEQLSKDDYIVKIGTEHYPKFLEKTEQACPFLFMRGNVELLKFPGVAVVGSRQPSEEGMKKASKLAELLGKRRIVVISGLAKGIDRSAHEGALNSNNPTIAVIGTPITKSYPNENKQLQDRISKEGLIISQFPPSSPVHRWNFPLRNGTMSGISLATIIVEAGETSGSLIQADYALKQGRLVFIPQSALENEKLNWPKKYIRKEGATSFTKIEELMLKLETSKSISKFQTQDAENGKEKLEQITFLEE